MESLQVSMCHDPSLDHKRGANTVLVQQTLFPNQMESERSVHLTQVV